VEGEGWEAVLCAVPAALAGSALLRVYGNYIFWYIVHCTQATFLTLAVVQGFEFDCLRNVPRPGLARSWPEQSFYILW
jgi:hypothetical protein